MDHGVGADGPLGEDDLSSERIEVAALDGTIVIRLHGEMDIARSETFRLTLRHALPAGTTSRHVVVDLQHLTFCDSAGLHALLEARRQAARLGHELCLAAPREQFLRLLELTGTLPLFAVRPAPPF
ncbi:STAS domain-containing protein [Streptomyces sp. NPDC086023]|uniref:STAS domain-containing protein n=1 Tax=Streptomyces sp. NPDC086023 TaxID=3365746 RepID=UPI0037D3BC7D